MKMKAARHSL